MVSSGNCKYRLKALLDQRPRIWIAESGIPTDAAVEAPPIRKECVLMEASGKQADYNTDRKFRVRKEPSENWNKGPELWDEDNKNLDIAETGHTLE